jgi:hypothetical protein
VKTRELVGRADNVRVVARGVESSQVVLTARTLQSRRTVRVREEAVRPLTQRVHRCSGPLQLDSVIRERENVACQESCLDPVVRELENVTHQESRLDRVVRERENVLSITGHSRASTSAGAN